MRVLYDYQIFSQQRHGGISRYFCELARRLARHPDCDVSVFAPLYVSTCLATLPKDVVHGVRVPALPRTTSARSNVNRAISVLAAPALRHDIIHPTYYALLPRTRGSTKTVVTVYDMIHERFASHFSDSGRLADAKRRAVIAADSVICISESTKRDLLTYIDLDPGKVFVTHLAQSFPKDVAVSFTASPVTSPYLLFVGPRGGYKNFALLVRAFASSRAAMAGMRLIAFGGGPLSEAERSHIHDASLSEVQVLHAEGDDATLAQYYSHAEALVYPSLYEGFGIPLLEAMHFGCPVICGNNSSLPEVAGPAAQYFDAHAQDSLSEAVDQVVFSSDRREELRHLGFQRRHAFSWDRCAEATLSLYKST